MTEAEKLLQTDDGQLVRPDKPDPSAVTADKASEPGEHEPKPVARDLPQHIGRYRVGRILGEGGFGRVYLALDEQLQRLVAIKVPHRRLVSRAEDAEAYLAEARTVANLDYPNIVPVYDVGSTEDWPCFVVSKYIEGCTLADRIKDDPPSTTEAVELVATVAEALHYAHRKGLVHRDVKPGNILLDSTGKPFVVDFGLALKEENVGRGPKFAGTPTYMSPEQARGEGHRVDGRSDIFSLGVVFYELLSGRQPFRADSQLELLEQITAFEPRPLRQIDEGIPKELERICFKAMSKRAADRYMTAQDMADDLRHFWDAQTFVQPPAAVSRTAPVASVAPTLPPALPSLRSTGDAPTPPGHASASDNQPVKIIPKGLRSFDAQDADFFLELLPGPRDRGGLPDSVRFWKSRVEEKDPDNTFALGLIYGPSGCGKSSLVKAGLLPRLSDEVRAVYIEATANETETRLLNGLRKRWPALPANLGLKELLAALRRGQGPPAGTKVLLVLDQFEQWLHATKEEPNTELVQALRQCDGGRVQCIVLVRDDFWMGVTRFMRELEVRILEGQNSAVVDLFPARHAEKVLAGFGRAFGVLPDRAGDLDRDQKQFLEQAVRGLAQEGKVICVRLALFAEMMKGKAWTPGTLKAVGGTEGVGVTFLEETFSASTAPPEHRYHQKAARAVLRALLPESGTDIKGHMHSWAELLEASGYGSRPKDFQDLVHILDSDIRLITPTDPEGREGDSHSPVEPGQKYYQLTHDYLVPSLRDWLTRKQKETRRGRAELLLADRANVWNARPEYRQLPSLPQWVAIKWLTRQKDWTEPQRKMMRRASRYHAGWGLAVTGLLLLLTLAGLGIERQVVRQYRANHAAGLVQRLLDSHTAQVPGIVAEIEGYREWADPLLREENERAAPGSRQKLHTGLALLAVDPTQVNYLYGRLLEAAPDAVTVLRDALQAHRSDLLPGLWAVAEHPAPGREPQRLRAACALARFDPESPRWAEVRDRLADDLVAVPAVYLATWMDALRPVQGALQAPLTAVFRDPKRPETERSLATSVLADYAANQPLALVDLLLDADAKQFAVLFSRFKDQGAEGPALLAATLERRLPPDASDDAREQLARRQVNAAVALLRSGQAEKVWPLFRHGPDPRVRSYLIHRLDAFGADPRAVLQRLDVEPDLTVRRALVLCLGEFGAERLTKADRETLIPKLVQTYRDEPDPGLHGAVEWLLRLWKRQEDIERIDGQWAKDKERRLERIRQDLARDPGAARPQWYVNGQGQTMVVLPGPVEFLMGSPPTEAGRFDEELQHRRRIGRTFALAAKAVTVEQFRRFEKDYSFSPELAPTPDCPVPGPTWYSAAAYCNWLSKQEGIPESEWCYQPTKDGKYEEGMKLVPDYLKRTGYRLPTEAEREYACRAGAGTSRYFGETEELLKVPKYGWYMVNSSTRTWPVGSLKPNDFGLFDMLGNTWGWCQERKKDYALGTDGKAVEDTEDASPVVDKEGRMMRGGGFGSSPVFVRSAYRAVVPPTTRMNDVGFRLARTFR